MKNYSEINKIVFNNNHVLNVHIMVDMSISSQKPIVGLKCKSLRLNLSKLK